jgi:hypothetical protein
LESWFFAGTHNSNQNKPFRSFFRDQRVTSRLLWV